MAFLDIVLHRYEPQHQEALSHLLVAGKGPRQVLDVLQIGAAQVLLETQDTLNFSIPQHCYEYLNTLGWFYDNFEHPQRLKLLYVATSYLNRNAWHARQTGDGREAPSWQPSGADTMAPPQLVERIVAAIAALDGPQRWGGRALISSVPPTRRRLSSSWRWSPAASAMTRTIRNWAKSCLKTTRRTAASTEIACCSRACSTPLCIASMATSWKRVGAMAPQWV
jgi:hypothetical protein